MSEGPLNESEMEWLEETLMAYGQAERRTQLFAHRFYGFDHQCGRV
jgi:hypothetical protein